MAEGRTDPQRRWAILNLPRERDGGTFAFRPHEQLVRGPDTDWVEVVPADDRLTAEEARVLLFEIETETEEDATRPIEAFGVYLSVLSIAVHKLARLAGRED